VRALLHWWLTSSHLRGSVYLFTARDRRDPESMANACDHSDAGQSERERQEYERARKLEEDVREEEKQKAIQRCSKDHQIMMKCLENASAWNGLCIEESKQFWSCFRRERGFLQLRVKKWLDEGKD
jgi:hypothetical protein